MDEMLSNMQIQLEDMLAAAEEESGMAKVTYENGWRCARTDEPEVGVPVLACVHGCDTPIVLELRQETPDPVRGEYCYSYTYWHDPNNDGQDYGDSVILWHTLPEMPPVTQPAEHEQYDNEYTVTWVGMDGVYYEDEFKSLDDAQRHAVSISEYGGHTITVFDVNDDEYDW